MPYENIIAFVLLTLVLLVPLLKWAKDKWMEFKEIVVDGKHIPLDSCSDGGAFEDSFGAEAFLLLFKNHAGPLLKELKRVNREDRYALIEAQYELRVAERIVELWGAVRAVEKIEYSQTNVTDLEVHLRKAGKYLPSIKLASLLSHVGCLREKATERARALIEAKRIKDKGTGSR